MEKEISVRSPSEQEYIDLLKFLDKTLRPQNQWSISAEYPTTLSQENLHNLRMIKDGNEVLSHAALKPHILKTPMAIFKVAAIGSVVTNDHYRNQGYSKKVLEDCLELAKKQDCDVAVLWTNLFDFYKKIGFSLAGYEISIVIDENFKGAEDSKVKIMKGSQVDPLAIHKVMNQHTVLTFRSPEDVKKFMKIPNSNIYTVWEPSGQLSAYAVEGKGADLTGYIHEWGGSVAKLSQLFKYIQKDQNKNIVVICPKHSTNLITDLTSRGGSYHEGFLGMIKIINENNFFNKIHKHARSDLGINNLVLEKKDSEYRIGTYEQFLSTNEISDLVPLIFGPADFRHIPNLKPHTIQTLERLFPIPFWLWGWDSI